MGVYEALNGARRSCNGDKLVLILMQVYTESSEKTDMGKAAPESTNDPTSERYLGVLSAGCKNCECAFCRGGVGMGRRLSSAHVEPGGVLAGGGGGSRIGSLGICMKFCIGSGYQWHRVWGGGGPKGVYRRHAPNDGDESRIVGDDEVVYAFHGGGLRKSKT